MIRWQPREFIRFEKSIGTSMATSVVMTDAGKAYVKALGSRQGPQPLACEWIGSHLAQWFGLSTFEFALLQLTDLDSFPLIDESTETVGYARPGPAFATRAVAGGFQWGGDEKVLKKLSNPADLSRLVVLDTWLLNCDRYRPAAIERSKKLGVRPRARRRFDNVFLAPDESDPAKHRLIAMDFTHILTCGGELNPKLASVSRTQETTVYGLFPEFRSFIEQDVIREAADKLRAFKPADAESAIASIPQEWEVDSRTRTAIIEFLTRRSTFLADRIYNLVGEQIGTPDWSPTLFDHPPKEGES